MRRRTTSWRTSRRPVMLGALAALIGLVAMPLVTTATAAHADPAYVSDPASYVNTLNGTGSGGANVGSINNFPGPATPFGMVQFSPDTTNTYAGYSHDNSTLKGFSLTHASVGCTAFGDIPILPTTGAVGSTPWTTTATIAHDSSEVGSPGYYAADLTNSGIKAELTASTRTGLATFTFPSGATSNLFVRPGASINGDSAAALSTVDDQTVTGSATTGGFCGKNNSYTVYFAMKFDTPFASTGTWNESSVSASSTSVDSPHAGAYYTFPAGTTTLHVKVSLSYVSTAGALANMQAEVPGFDAAALRAQTAQEWNDALGKVKVAGQNQDDLKTFYTSLYRSMLHPNTFNDVDGRYIGFDGTTYSVPSGHTQYANFSDWDTYRSLAPLQAMLFPDRASDMAQSLVNDAEQSGSFPRWELANASTGQMTGDSETALISSLYAFGAKDFDTSTALNYMVKGATDGGTGLNGYVERPGLATYLKDGYAPQTKDFQADHAIAGASVTLEWSVDDFAIGRFASALGQTDIGSQFQTRGQNWQNLFNPTTGYISPRSASGQFADGPGYVTPGSGQFGQAGFDEGNAAQYLWLVPQNVAGLTTALGGDAAVADRLDSFFTQLNVGPNEPYMWAGNEPNFQTPWLYNYVGQPWKTQQVVDRIRTTLFSDSPDGEPGNDDLGAQSSWYVWAALGLYPTTPGTDLLTVNTPTFDQEELDLSGGRTITISANGASTGSRYISGLSVNGSAQQKTYLPESVLAKGGDVDFTLSSTHDTSWGTAPDDAPPSFADGSASFVANASPSLVSATPGSAATIMVAAQRLTGSDDSYTVAVTAPAGLSAGSIPVGRFDTSGAGTTPITLTAAKSTPNGYYTVDVAVTSGSRTVHASVTVKVARTFSMAAAANTVGTASESDTGVGDFDAAGNSYSREQLASVGLAPGATGKVGSLHFTWPSSPEGAPDAVNPTGQTIDLQGEVHSIAFIGAGINGGASDTAVATLDDGSTMPVDFSFGDWVLPTSDGSPAFGNSVVAKMSHRNAVTQVQGAYLFATTPATAPDGRTIVSVQFPTDSKERVFAIATDVAPATNTATQLTTSAASVASGSSLTLTAKLTPAQAAGSVEFFDGGASLGDAVVKNGSATLAVKPKSTGEHDYLASFSPSDDTAFIASSSAVVPVTVTGATPPPHRATLTVSESSVPAGGSLSVSGTGFAADSEVAMTLHSQPLGLGTATTNGDGSFVTTVTIPSQTAPGKHTLEAATSDGVAVSVEVTVTAKGTAATGGPSSATSNLAETGSSGIVELAFAALLTIALGSVALIVTSRVRRRRRTV
ncbi:alpha-1,2-mannosidase [Humibacter ginsenosidimutans]|uniref:Alpha-1,2-mannosidase n=2 Tax=Humibacter ginsenosidimutans TaxID=2599293 RepID=A0A5B8M4I2_9MICO|nr:alpha-1,2-mannosidase [Humibacter ginsenosidimutans]